MRRSKRAARVDVLREVEVPERVVRWCGPDQIELASSVAIHDLDRVTHLACIEHERVLGPAFGEALVALNKNVLDGEQGRGGIVRRDGDLFEHEQMLRGEPRPRSLRAAFCVLCLGE